MPGQTRPRAEERITRWESRDQPTTVSAAPWSVRRFARPPSAGMRETSALPSRPSRERLAEWLTAAGAAGTIAAALPRRPLMRATWTFHGPGQLLFGRHAVNQLGEVAGRLGAQRVLIVTDPVLLKAGLVSE